MKQNHTVRRYTRVSVCVRAQVCVCARVQVCMYVCVFARADMTQFQFYFPPSPPTFNDNIPKIDTLAASLRLRRRIYQ